MNALMLRYHTFTSQQIMVDNTHEILQRVIDQNNIGLTMFDDEDYGEDGYTDL